MTEQRNSRWEAVLQQRAQQVRYPATPDIAAVERRRLRESRPGQPSIVPRRLAWALVALLALMLAVLFAVPPARAALLEWLQVGAVRIWLVEPPATLVSPTMTPAPPPVDLHSLQTLGGETTLAAAQTEVPFKLRLPTYPADLGAPDRVYHQDLNGDAVVLVWLDEEEPARVRLTLHFLTSDVTAWKMQPTIESGGYVNGQPALWLFGPYLLALRNGNWDTVRLVQGHVLLWTADKVTYRLEGNLSLEEAIRVAESLE